MVERTGNKKKVKLPTKESEEEEKKAKQLPETQESSAVEEEVKGEVEEEKKTKGDIKDQRKTNVPLAKSDMDDMKEILEKEMARNSMPLHEDEKNLLRKSLETGRMK